MDIKEGQEVFHQVKNKFVQKQYKEDNYFVEYDEEVKLNTAAVYFSSNALYSPNTEDQFMATVVEKNRFEWRKNKIGSTYKHIFLRDVFKQWYLRGINNRIANYPELIKFIKKETEGFNTTFIGGSSGGFAACLVSSYIKVDRVLLFNAQFKLDQELEPKTIDKNPLLEKLQYSIEYKKFYDLKPVLKKSSSNIFYFTSVHSQYDIPQAEHVSKLDNIQTFKINSNTHGIPLSFLSLTAILNSSSDKLKRIATEKVINEKYFQFKLQPLPLILIKNFKLKVKNLLNLL